MRTLSRTLACLVLLASCAVPLSASALGLSFGGRVTAVLPCVSALGPSIYTTVLVARGVPHPEFYIWTPATITKSVGPPILGGQILGVADIPFVCFTYNPVTCGLFGLFSCLVPIPYFGLRMQLIGTSLPGSTAGSAAGSLFQGGGGSFGGGGSNVSF